MNTFWILWIFNAVMSLIPIYFFFIGLTDGTVTSKNIGLWVIILLIIAVVLAGSYLLMTNNHLGWAKALLIVAAVPGILTLLYFAVIIIGKPRWN